MKVQSVGMMIAAVVTAATLTGITGCGNAERDRFLNAMEQLEPNKEKLEKELKRFDEESKEEQLKYADYAEYIVMLRKASGGVLSTEKIKTQVGRQFEGKDAVERAKILEKARKEMQ